MPSAARAVLLVAAPVVAASPLPGQAHVPPRTLQPARWHRLRLGTVRPEGWLLSQVQLQAAALTSHLPLFWPNVANTSWLGGPADNDGGLHESTPYWLNGATPLAFQLGDPALLALVRQYIDGVLVRQTSEGWLGPDSDHGDFWSRYPFLLALAQYHEALPHGAERQRALDAAVRFLGTMARRLQGGVKLRSWSASRSHDLIWAIHYFVDALAVPAAGGGEDRNSLLALAELIHEQGFDWGAWFNSSAFPRAAVEDTTDFTHGVNNAQAIKHGAVWARQGGDAAGGTAKSWLAWEVLMRYHGQPNGIFSADEHLAGQMPSRGTELCVVVEAMWSLALVAQVAPTNSQATRALDALENVAFNALPGSLSDDLWSHPYLQFANSVQAVHDEVDHVWTHDGPDSAMYGLAPNYECCTANFHQGYPKLISHLFFMMPTEKALVSAVWAPSTVSLPDFAGGLELDLRTRYPFGMIAEYLIKNAEDFKLRVRLPSFLREVAGPGVGLDTVRVWLEDHEQIVELYDGFLEYTIPPWPEAKPRVALRIEWAAAPKVRQGPREQGASVFVGPLLLGLDLGEQACKVQQYSFAAADWDTTATAPWRYGLRLDAAGQGFGPLAWREPGPRPHRHRADACPLAVNATLLRVLEQVWPMVHGAPGPLPTPGTAAAGPPETRLLLPYACSTIRIAAFPLLNGQPQNVIQLV